MERKLIADILELEDKCTLRKELSQSLDGVRELRLKAEHKVLQCRVALREIQGEVEAYEGKSVRILYLKAIGKYGIAHQSIKEKLQTLQTEYDIAYEQLQGMENRYKSLQQEFFALQDAPSHLEAAKEARIQWLERNQPEKGRYLRQLSAELTFLGEYCSDIEQALTAGYASKEIIIEAERKLGSAEGWACLDLFGGNLLCGVQKHAQLSEAEQLVQSAQLRLRNFKELSGRIAGRQKLQLTMNTGLKIADFMLDGILMDWVALSRIGESQQKICELLHDVSGSLSSLHRAKGCTQEAIHKKSREFREGLVGEV